MNPMSFIDRLKLRLSTIAGFLLICGAVLALPVLAAASPVIIALIVGIGSALAVPIAWLLRRLRAASRTRPFARGWAATAIVLSMGLMILAAAPVWVLALANAYQPLAVPQATLSDGRRTVVLQGMMHVGSDTFFKSVVYDLEKALSDGYVLYYEGVKPAGDEADGWFSTTLAGGGDLSTHYRAIAETCGLHFQLDYFALLQADMQRRPERHVAADVTTADLKAEYDRLMRTDPAFAAAMASAENPLGTAKAEAATLSDAITRFLAWHREGTDGQRRLVGTVCRGVMSLVLARSVRGNAGLLGPIEAVILDYRNRELVTRLVRDPAERIYVTYGAAHLPGVIAALKAHDADWSVKSVKWIRPIDTGRPLDAGRPLDGAF